MRMDEKNLSARPPDVVSGLPNITPIFSRIWFVKMQTHFVLLTTDVRRRMAWDMSLAWLPMVMSPIWPSSSAFVISAATESSTITSIELDRIKVSMMLSASSPLSGCETRRSSRFTPTTRAYLGSSACSTSMKAARPPFF